MTAPKTRTRKTQQRQRFTGWSTSDADEIERRRLRGREEAIRIEALDRADTFFGTFLAHSKGGHAYRVEIRSLIGHINSCDCPDHRVNGLGTCKHIEFVLGRLLARLDKCVLNELGGRYIRRVMEVLKQPASRKRHVNVLQHLLGYLRQHAERGDRADLLEAIDGYRRGEYPLVVPVRLLRHHFRRHPHPYVSQQVYLEPYPAELMLRNAV